MLKRIFITLLLLTTPNLAHSEEMANIKPTKLVFHIGGFMGSKISIELKEGKLVYTGLDLDKTKQPNTASTLPTDEEYKQFRESLDAINVWDWKDLYFNPNVADGTQWSIEITYPDKSIKASGSNAYPLEDGKSNNSPYESDSFKKLLEAAQKLSHQKDFR